MQLLKQITPSEHGRAAIEVLQTSAELHGKRAMSGREDAKESFQVLLLLKSKSLGERVSYGFFFFKDLAVVVLFFIKRQVLIKESLHFSCIPLLTVSSEQQVQIRLCGEDSSCCA